MAAPYMDITSANTIVTLQADGLIPNPVRLEGFAEGGIADIGEIKHTESKLGCDGGMAVGWVPCKKTVNITLMGNSPSRVYLAKINNYMNSNKQTIPMNITVESPTMGCRYIFKNGTIDASNYAPAFKKTIEDTKMSFVFAEMLVENL